jgi:DNA polymerase-3 subunit alpha
VARVKDEYTTNPKEARKKYPDLFYYFDGLLNTAISQSMHPAGIIASPITLPDNYGTIWREGKRILSINMEEVHEVSLVKYDILGLKNIEVIKDTCKLLNRPYPISHEIDWDDKRVWEDIITSPIGIFQFESDFAFQLLKKYIPMKINDLSLVNACLRPSGESYRDRLINREANTNPSQQIDELLKDNNGFLVFQEDTIKFLQDICGLTGSEADNIRRAIGRKQKDRLDKAMPQILEGYCNKSDKPREIAESEAKAFLQIIEDSSNYQFGYSHSTGYSMIGYLCAYFRYYHPLEFITAYLNNANNENDIKAGTELAMVKGIKINPIKFRYSKANYFPDKETNSIYKGIASIKYCNSNIGEELYSLRDKQYECFVDFLVDLSENTSVNSRQLEILIKGNFFSEFGYNKKLLNIYKEFEDGKNRYDVKHKEATKIKRIAALKEFENQSEDEKLTVREQLSFEREMLGYAQSTYNLSKTYVYLLDVDTTYSPKLNCYCLANGKTETMKIDKKTFKKNIVSQGDIIRLVKLHKKPKMQKQGDEWIQTDIMEWWIDDYVVVNEF